MKEEREGWERFLWKAIDWMTHNFKITSKRKILLSCSKRFEREKNILKGTSRTLKYTSRFPELTTKKVINISNMWNSWYLNSHLFHSSHKFSVFTFRCLAINGFFLFTRKKKKQKKKRERHSSEKYIRQGDEKLKETKIG